MTAALPELSDVVAALRQVGFVYQRTELERLLFDGVLEANGERIACRMSLNRRYLDLPWIQLVEVPSRLRPVAPHVNPSGFLCYAAKGSITLDIFDPVGQTIACIRRAENVLADVIKGVYVDDLEEEFYAHWGGQSFCYLDIEQDGLGAQLTRIVNGDPLRIVITDNEPRTKAKLDALGWELKDSSITTFRVKTVASPRPRQDRWPLETVRDIVSWQGLLDSNCRKRIQERLKQASDKGRAGAFVLIRSPKLEYAFAVAFGQRAPRQPKQSWQQLLDCKAIPMNVTRIDDRYLAERNTPGKATLAKRSITLVGCGTIGGYLAEMLVKAGAGTVGGHLTLVDPDTLQPQNIGRHRLGFGHINRSKAVALREELIRSMPSASVEAIVSAVQNVTLTKADLLIDATGEESLGYWLAANPQFAHSMISVWIEGAGVAARALLRASPDDACYRCLTDAVKAGELAATEETVPEIFAGQGCESLYVPFPTTASVRAAALGAELAFAWANREPHPCLRTDVLDRTFHRGSNDCSPQRRAECPACSS